MSDPTQHTAPHHETASDRTASEARAGDASTRVNTVLIVSAVGAFLALILIWLIYAFVLT